MTAISSFAKRVMTAIPPLAKRLRTWLENVTLIALLMAFVAMLGALAAFRSATAEQEWSERENKLNQSQIMELTKRQEYLDLFTARGRFETENKEHLTEGARLWREANQLRAVDPAQAARRDVEAQAQFNAARILQPYLQITWVSGMGSDLSLQDVVDQNVAQDLKRMGFGSQWVQPENSDGKAQSMWEAQKAEIGILGDRLIGLTKVVFVFVAALACLTLAELWRQKAGRMLLMSAVGILIAAGGIFFFTQRIDPGSKKMFFWCAIAFLALGFVGSRLALLVLTLAQKIAVWLGFLQPDETEEETEEECAHVSEVDPLLPPVMRAHMEFARHAFPILVILLIVATILFSALLAVAYSRATIEAKRAASNAVDDLTESFKTSHDASIHFFLSSLASTQEQRLAYKAALQEIDLAQAGLLKIDKERVEEDEKKLLKNLSSSQGADNGQTLDGSKGPEKDLGYPRQILFGDRRKESDTAFALSDAENERSLALHTKAYWYLMTLTFLAIALYLFGQSLAMRQQLGAASWLVFFGVCLVAIGAGITVYHGWKALPGSHYTVKDVCRDKEAKTDQNQKNGKDQKTGKAGSEAARHYAAGRAFYDTEDYAGAEKEFDCAVDARPTFALASYYLARASTAQASPQHGEGYISMLAEETMEQIVTHEQTFVSGVEQEGFAVDSDLMGNYGFDSYLLGLAQKKQGKQKQDWISVGLQETQKALDQDTKNEYPFLRFNKGLALLASGKQSDAIDAYNKAMKDTPAAEMQNGLAVASINDLEVFLHYCPGIWDAAYCKGAKDLENSLKEQFVQAAWPAPKDDPGSTPHPSLTNVGLVASPAGLGWHARRQDFRDSDVLVVLWYKYEDKWGLWRGLPNVSAKVEPKNTRTDADGNTREFRSYLKATGQHKCAENGNYRAEFYLNGKLLDLDPQVSRISLSYPPLTAANFGDLNICLCHPDGWDDRWRPENPLDAFMAGGYWAKDHSRGVFALNYYLPRLSLDEAAKKKLAMKSLAYLPLNKSFPENSFSTEPNTCQVYPREQTVFRVRSPDGMARALVRVWASEEGIVHVGVTYHRSASPTEAVGADDVLGPKTEECNALRSMREVYEPSDTYRASPWIGIGVDYVAGQGVVLKNVVRGSPASRAGLQVGDVITEWDGKPAEPYDKFKAAVGSWEAGSEVRITYMRGASKLETTLTVGEK